MAFTGTTWIGTQDYTAQQDRMFAMGLFFCEGVLPAIGESPQQALQAVPGSGLSVNISPGWGIVRGDDLKNQGTYADYNEGSILNFTNPFGAPAGAPRVDLVGVQVRDSEATPGASGADQMAPVWVRGTEQPGADPTDQAFWPSLPSTTLLLASVVIAPGQSTLRSSDLVDQRTLAGPMIWGEDGNRYRLGVDDNGNLGVQAL
jgi:hypothetical protein